MQFSGRWTSGTISPHLELIWGMSAKVYGTCTGSDKLGTAMLTPD